VLLLISLLLITTVSTLPLAFQISTLPPWVATYTTKATDGTWSIDTSVAPDSGTLAFDENGGHLASVTAMDVAGNIATVLITTVSTLPLAFQISTLPPWVLIFSLKLGSFYLKMASGVITDMAGNDAAAITKDSNQWVFEIKALSTSISLAGTNNTDDAYIYAAVKSNAVLSGNLLGLALITSVAEEKSKVTALLYWLTSLLPLLR
jgi:hypothetical protein